MGRVLSEIFVIACVALLSIHLALSSGLSYPLTLTLGALGAMLVPTLLLLRERATRIKRTYSFIQRLIDGIPDPFYIKDADSRYVMVNEAFARERGRSNEELIGKTSWDLARRPEIAEESAREDRAVILGEDIRKEQRIEHPVTGEECFRIMWKRRVANEDGIPVVVGAHLDTTRWMVAERNFQAAVAREKDHRERVQYFIQCLIDVIPDPLYVKNAESRFLMVNDAFAKERGRPKHELLGLTSYDLALTPEAGELAAQEDQSVLAGNEIHKEQHTTMPVTGEECFRIVSKRRCIDADGQPVIVGAHFYITRWKIAERELERIAHEDMLTGIANRRYFLAEAERAVSRAARHGEALSLLLFDLDHFKRVNDAHGHQAGDEVLCEIVRRARTSLRTEDLPGRWGGEEFIVLLPLTLIDDALYVANRLREAVGTTPITTCAGALTVTASCGVAQWYSAESLDTLIARADAALYDAKHAGRNVCVAASTTGPN